MCQVNNERERNILGEVEDQIGREPIWWRRRRKENEKEKKEGRKEKNKEKKRKNKKEGECVRVRGKRDDKRRKKKEKKKGTTVPFAISGEPTVETRWGKRQSWST